MSNGRNLPPIPAEQIERAILVIRGQKIMLDRDLAELYGVPTGVLNQAVKRNLNRFLEDFMFQLSQEEFANWKSQIVISNPAAKMGLRKRPYAFTEQGVAMLSSVLHSDRPSRSTSPSCGRSCACGTSSRHIRTWLANWKNWNGSSDSTTKSFSWCSRRSGS
jgi:hypothetical protein